MSELPASDFDFEYPEELIASEPLEPRDGSKLLVVDRAGGERRHLIFRDLPSQLEPGDCIVLNRTKVLACRLIGKKSTGGKTELLLVAEKAPGLWSALGSGLRKGARLEFPGGLGAEVLGLTSAGEYLIRFDRADILRYLEAHGAAPLPPYIAKRRSPSATDLLRYQTVYALEPGSIAAPTAGLHFTDAVLSALRARGIAIAYVTLHVGRGTFRPIVGEDAARHAMLPERYEMDAEDAALVSKARAAGRRVVAVGTTSTRTLETLGARPEGFGPGSGESSLYITPGHRFRVVSALVTNFHLPRSTPLVLASAFLGRERLLETYRDAIARRYRLYSYGDAMLVL